MDPAGFNPRFVRYILRLRALRVAVLWLAGSGVLLLLACAMVWSAHTEHLRLADEVFHQRKQQVANVKLARSTQLAAAALPQLRTLERMLELDSSQSEMARRLTELAEKNGLRAEAQTYADKSAAAGHAVYQQEVMLRGPYSALRSYLLDLRRSAAWIEIAEIRVQRAANQPGVVQASLRIVAYKRGNRP